MKAHLSVVLPVVTALLVLPVWAAACMCTNPVTADKEFERSATVGVFRITSVFQRREGVEDPKTPEEGIEPLYTPARRVTFSVEKVFKGALKPGDEVRLVKAGTCDRYFDESMEGKEYLLYLSSDPSKDKEWTVSGCSRSNDVTAAAADLLYLEKMARVRGKTRLSGMAIQSFWPAAEGEVNRREILMESPIVIKGNGKTIRLKTDKNGVYEIYDLAPGRYRVTPIKIRGYKFIPSDELPYLEVDIKAGALAELDFTFVIDNAIRGRVLDSKGRGLEEVDIELVPTRGRKPDNFFSETQTEKGGYFEFESVPAGSYLIVVNPGGKITAQAPFGKFYYPGAAARAGAAPVSIGAGEFIKNLIVTAPKTAETVTLSGVLLYEDGKPAKSLVQFFEDVEEGEEDDPAADDDEDRGADGFLQVRLNSNRYTIENTDEQGRFSVRILKGRKGLLVGIEPVYLGLFADCPQVDKLIREALAAKDPPQDEGNAGTVLLKSAGVRVDGTGDLSGIELRYPFTGCKEK
jgi:hypothetical protein